MHCELGVVLKYTHSSFMTLFARTFVGYFLVTLFKTGHFSRYTRLGSSSPSYASGSNVEAVVGLAVLGGFKTKTTSWAHFRRPSSSSSSFFVHDRGQEAKTSLDLWCCAVHITHYSNSVTQLWLAPSRFIVVVVVQVSINSNSLPVRGVFLFPVR